MSEIAQETGCQCEISGARAEIALNTIISLRYQLNDARDTVAQQSARDETENGMQHPSFPAKPGRKLCFLDGIIQKPSSP